MPIGIRSKLPESQPGKSAPRSDCLHADVRIPWQDSWVVLALFGGAALIVTGALLLFLNFDLGEGSPKISELHRWSFALKGMVDPDRGAPTTGFAVTTIVAGLVTLWITRTSMYRRKRRLVEHAKNLEVDTF